MQILKKYLKHISLLSCFVVVPFLTIALASKADLLKYNFTHLSSQTNSVALYFIWAISTILTASLAIYAIKKKYNLYKPTKKQVVTLTIVMLASSFTPYNSNDNLISFIHVSSAYIVLIYFNYILFTLYNFLKLNNNKRIIKVSYFYVLSFSTCFVLSMMFGSISSLVEIIYTISTSLLLGILLY